MKTKHTAGPWKAETVAGRTGMVVKAGDDCIVDLWHGNGYRRDELVANARLIAAAPVLRDCVLAFVNRFSNAVESDEPIEGADAVDWISQHSAEFRAALKISR